MKPSIVYKGMWGGMGLSAWRHYLQMRGRHHPPSFHSPLSFNITTGESCDRIRRRGRNTVTVGEDPCNRQPPSFHERRTACFDESVTTSTPTSSESYESLSSVESGLCVDACVSFVPMVIVQYEWSR